MKQFFVDIAIFFIQLWKKCSAAVASFFVMLWKKVVGLFKK